MCCKKGKRKEIPAVLLGTLICNCICYFLKKQIFEQTEKFLVITFTFIF